MGLFSKMFGGPVDLEKIEAELQLESAIAQADRERAERTQAEREPDAAVQANDPEKSTSSTPPAARTDHSHTTNDTSAQDLYPPQDTASPPASKPRVSQPPPPPQEQGVKAMPNPSASAPNPPPTTSAATTPQAASPAIPPQTATTTTAASSTRTYAKSNQRTLVGISVSTPPKVPAQNTRHPSKSKSSQRKAKRKKHSRGSMQPPPSVKQSARHTRQPTPPARVESPPTASGTPQPPRTSAATKTLHASIPTPSKVVEVPPTKAAVSPPTSIPTVTVESPPTNLPTVTVAPATNTPAVTTALPPPHTAVMVTSPPPNTAAVAVEVESSPPSSSHSPIDVNLDAINAGIEANRPVLLKLRQALVELQLGPGTLAWLQAALAQSRTLKRGALPAQAQQGLTTFEQCLENLIATAGVEDATTQADLPPAAQHTLDQAIANLIQTSSKHFDCSDLRTEMEGPLVLSLLRWCSGMTSTKLAALELADRLQLRTLLSIDPAQLQSEAQLGPALIVKVQQVLRHYWQQRQQLPPYTIAEHAHAQLQVHLEAWRGLDVAWDEADTAANAAAKRELVHKRAQVFADIRVRLAELGATDLLSRLEEIPTRQRRQWLETAAEFAWQVPPEQAAALELSQISPVEFDQDISIRPSFSDTDLRALSLQGRRLRRIDLEGADLRGVNLSQADLSYANLRQSCLVGAILQGTNLQGADLEGANLSAANLQNAELSRANLSCAVLTGAQFEGTRLCFAQLDGAELSDAVLKQADLSHTSLRHAVAFGLRAEQSNLRHSHWPHAQLFDVQWHTTAAPGSVFESAHLEHAHFSACDFRDSNGQHSRIKHSAFVNCKLQRCDWEHSELHQVALTGSAVRGLRLPAEHRNQCTAAWIDVGDGSNPQRLDGELARAWLHDEQKESSNPQRFLGPGDTLSKAELSFGAGARVHIESRLEQCTLHLGAGAELVVGEKGVLVGCRIVGGRLTIQGRFIEGDTPGLDKPTHLAVMQHAAVAATVLQPPGKTSFAFERGCQLQLHIHDATAGDAR